MDTMTMEAIDVMKVMRDQMVKYAVTPLIANAVVIQTAWHYARQSARDERAVALEIIDAVLADTPLARTADEKLADANLNLQLANARRTAMLPFAPVPTPVMDEHPMTTADRRNFKLAVRL